MVGHCLRIGHLDNSLPSTPLGRHVLGSGGFAMHGSLFKIERPVDAFATRPLGATQTQFC